MINKLQQEHDHILRTLNLLELQFMDLCRGGQPDYDIMRSIIVYIQEYPEQVHHPLEDEVFSILLEREEQNNKLVQELIKDHTELEVVTRKLRASLEALKDGTIAVAEIKQQLSQFISRQRQHLYIEETKVYPLIKSLITDEDWEVVQSIVPIQDDPVFGERTQEAYQRLHHEITHK